MVFLVKARVESCVGHKFLALFETVTLLILFSYRILDTNKFYLSQ